VPNFGPVETSRGRIEDWHAELGEGWAVLFSHPRDYTPVCTTELGTAARMSGEFARRGVRLYSISLDGADSHAGWVRDVEQAPWAGGAEVDFPIIADTDGRVAELYGMFDPRERDGAGNAVTARAVFFIQGRRVRASLLYPASSGRDFDEMLRLIDSMQLADAKRVATPANWRPGDRAMVVPGLSDAEAEALFDGVDRVAVPSGRGYLRMVDPDTYRDEL